MNTEVAEKGTEASKSDSRQISGSVIRKMSAIVLEIREFASSVDTENSRQQMYGWLAKQLVNFDFSNYMSRILSFSMEQRVGSAS